MTEDQIEAKIEATYKDFVAAVETSCERWIVRAAIHKAFSQWVLGMLSLEQQNAALRAEIVRLGGNPDLP